MTGSELLSVVEQVQSMEAKERFRQDLMEWGENHIREFPWRDEECAPYEVFVAEMLLRRTRAEKVEPIYREFIDEYPDLAALADADVEELASILAPLGLQNIRADALTTIAARHLESGIPDTEDELLSLPQAGRYVANAVLCFGHGQRRAVVDANVARIYSRVFDLDIKGDQLHLDEELWEFSWDLLPNSRFRAYNLALLDFGAEVCTPQSPDCEGCFANDYCKYYQSDRDGG